jgi:hypothetical protein
LEEAVAAGVVDAKTRTLLHLGSDLDPPRTLGISSTSPMRP